MKNNSSIIPLIIAVIIFAAGLYWYFSTSTGNQLALTATTPNGESQSQFQSLFGKLTTISFNTSIFSDSRFNALVDLTTPVATEPTGRLDPFASITSMQDVSSQITMGSTLVASTTTPRSTASTTTPRTATSTVTKVKKN